MRAYSFRNLILGYTLTVAVILLILFYIFSTLQSQEKELHHIRQTREAMQVLGPALINIQEFQSRLIEASTSPAKNIQTIYQGGLSALREDSIAIEKLDKTGNDELTSSNYRQLIRLQEKVKYYSGLVYTASNSSSFSTDSLTFFVKSFKAIVNNLENKNRQAITASYDHTVALTRKTFGFVKAIAGALFVILTVSFVLHYRDVKKRRVAEAELRKLNEVLEKKIDEKTTEIRKNEEKLNLIYNATTDIIFLVTVKKEGEYYFESVNKAFLNALGLTKAQVEGKNLKEVIAGPSLALGLGKYSEVLRTKKPVSWEQVSEYPSGKKSGIVTITPIMNENGECVMMAGIAHDITERKKAEQELIEAESKFRTLIEQSLVGIYIIDQAKFVYVNPRFAQIFGYTQEELIGDTPLKVIIDDDRAMVAENVRARVAGEKDSVHYEAGGLKKNGEAVRLEIFCSGSLHKGSTAIIGTILDITERKQAEEEIIKANERFNLIARATNDIVWDWDIVNDRNWGNDVFYKYYGLEPGSESNNATFLEKVHPEDKERILGNLQKAIDTKEEQVIDEFRFRMPDGTYRHFYDRAYIIYNHDGKPVRMLGSMMDMTGIKEAEAQKEKALYLLNERMKELTLLYKVGQLLNSETGNPDETLQKILLLLPGGWQYPEIAAARIVLDTKEFTTSNYAPGVASQSAELTGPDGKTGKIEIIYLEQRQGSWEGPFLAEERDLINMLANMINIYLARRYEADKLRNSEANLHTIFDTTDVIYVLLDRSFRIISYNQRFYDFSVKELNKIPGDNDYLPGYFEEARRPVLLDSMERALHGQHSNYEATYLKTHGNASWYHKRVFPISNDKGEVLGLMLAITDITDKKRLEQLMLDQKVQEQKKITRAVLKAEERERNKIGQELHDNVNQILAGTKIYLKMADKKEGNVRTGIIQDSLELVDKAIEEIRSLSKGQVTPLKGVNLEELIYSLIDKLHGRSPVNFRVVYDVRSGIIEDDIKLNVYRIVQEQINNILKHASAASAIINIKDDFEFLYLTIEDDGKGFDPTQKRTGIGISNMINRVESFNGELEIETAPGNGCKLKIKIPY